MPYELDFLPVGDSNGDAIVLREGPADSFYLYVIDGGFTDTADTIISHIEKYYGAHVRIHHMVLSHADNDHATGLIGVLERFEVQHLWMNRPWLYAADCVDSFHGTYTVDGLIAKMREMHPYLVDLENIANDKGTKVHPIFRGDNVGSFHVLAPSRERYIKLIPELDKTPPSYDAAKATGSIILDTFKSLAQKVKEALDIETLDDNPPPTSASNETSVVQLAHLDERSILLTADVGPDGLTEAADYAEALGLLAPPSVVQIPHHGSRRNVTPKVLNRWFGGYPAGRRGSAFVSVGKDADIYPRKRVKNAFIRRGYDVIATRGSAKYSFHGYNMREGWIAVTPEEFSPDVED